MRDNQVHSQQVRLNVARHRNGNLLVATSPDIPGFSHVARSTEQLESELEEAIRDFWSAEGKRLVRFESLGHVSDMTAFSAGVMRVNTEMEAA